MRSAARKPEHDEDREPPREDPRARDAALRGQLSDVLRLLQATGNADLIWEVIGLSRRYAEHTAAVRQLLAALYGEDRAYAAGRADEARAASARAKVPAPRHAGGRAFLNVVRALLPAATVGLAAKLWTAHRIAAPVAAAALAASVTAVGVQTMRTLPDTSARVPAPAASISSAAPVASPSPAALIRSRPKGAVVRSGHLVAAVPGGPARVPASAASPVSPVSPAPASLLSLSTSELDLGVYLASQPGAVSLGDNGPAVAWSVSCTQGITVTPAQGIMAAGPGRVPIAVRIDPAGRTGGWCDFTPEGGQAVRLTVTWDG